jgi:DNA-binding transcriptional MerR regulator
MEKALPAIPAKRYFTIGEVSELCGVKPYVLRYWEQEFTQLKPMKRRGNRRYYQHHEVLLIRRIRDLLYEQGFTISGARNRLTELGPQALHAGAVAFADAGEAFSGAPLDPARDDALVQANGSDHPAEPAAPIAARFDGRPLTAEEMRQELLSIRELLGP